jgi:hypothetical protein
MQLRPLDASSTPRPHADPGSTFTLKRSLLFCD